MRNPPLRRFSFSNHFGDPISSPAKIAANKANAQLSTGPVSPEGKARTSLNAVKTGLTGRTVLLPGDDAAAYQAHLDRFFAKLKPANDAESTLVQAITDTEWRLLRIPALESNLYALGRIELAELFENEDASLRPALIDAKILVVYHRQFVNLGVQEARLRRQRSADTQALDNLQSRRKGEERSKYGAILDMWKKCEGQGIAFDPAQVGFESSMERLQESVAYYKECRKGSPEIVARLRSKAAA